ncbi:MAG: hypothetical protein KKH94_08295 [Candidatus Omnitrophica bacterium]|nr:hypothetical protein [Candidatus Omnitrophota bacterium]
MLQKLISYSLIIALLLTSSGCSLFVEPTQMITVTASEKDADIYIEGIIVGQGTVSKSVASNRAISVMAWREGYRPAVQTVRRKMSKAGILDTIGGHFFLIPYVGLLAAGAWELQETDISLRLSKT